MAQQKKGKDHTKKKGGEGVLTEIGHGFQHVGHAIQDVARPIANVLTSGHTEQDISSGVGAGWVAGDVPAAAMLASGSGKSKATKPSSSASKKKAKNPPAAKDNSLFSNANVMAYLNPVVSQYLGGLQSSYNNAIQQAVNSPAFQTANSLPNAPTGQDLASQLQAAGVNPSLTSRVTSMQGAGNLNTPGMQSQDYLNQLLAGQSMGAAQQSSYLGQLPQITGVSDTNAMAAQYVNSLSSALRYEQMYKQGFDPQAAPDPTVQAFGELASNQGLPGATAIAGSSYNPFTTNSPGSILPKPPTNPNGPVNSPAGQPQS